MAQRESRPFYRAVEAEALRLLVTHVEFVQIVAVDHCCRCPAFVGDPPDVFSREYTQRDVPAAQRVRRRLLQKCVVRVPFSGNAATRLDVADEVVLLLQGLVAVGGGAPG